MDLKMLPQEQKPKRPSFRTFPQKLIKSERASFAQYMEESGTNSLLIDAVSKLFHTAEKPENPLEWLRLYFRQSAPKRDEEFEKAQVALRDDIMKQETRLTYFRMEELRLTEKLEELEYEAQKLDIFLPKPTHDEDFRRYRDSVLDPRWRIQPDPSVVIAKNDFLVQLVENEKKLGRSRTNVVPASAPPYPCASERLPVEYSDPSAEYQDYPELYFGPDNLVDDLTMKRDYLISQSQETSVADWTEDIQRQMQILDEEFGFGVDEDKNIDPNDVEGEYFSSRGERRKRKFRSQIIHEGFWKPDRGRSIQFDSRFDLADIPVMSSNASSVAPQLDPQDEQMIPPSAVSATISDGTIFARIENAEKESQAPED